MEILSLIKSFHFFLTSNVGWDFISLFIPWWKAPTFFHVSMWDGVFPSFYFFQVSKLLLGNILISLFLLISLFNIFSSLIFEIIFDPSTFLSCQIWIEILGMLHPPHLRMNLVLEIRCLKFQCFYLVKFCLIGFLLL